MEAALVLCMVISEELVTVMLFTITLVQEDDEDVRDDNGLSEDSTTLGEGSSTASLWVPSP